LTWGPDLEKAYFNTEIIDAYCRILILARQIGQVHYFSTTQLRELLDLKMRMGYSDRRVDLSDKEICTPKLASTAKDQH
jgi:L-fuculose-phosphate aldolase